MVVVEVPSLVLVELKSWPGAKVDDVDQSGAVQRPPTRVIVVPGTVTVSSS